MARTVNLLGRFVQRFVIILVLFFTLLHQGITHQRAEIEALTSAIRAARNRNEHNIVIRSNNTYVVDTFKDGRPNWRSIHANEELIVNCFETMENMNVSIYNNSPV